MLRATFRSLVTLACFATFLVGNSVAHGQGAGTAGGGGAGGLSGVAGIENQLADADAEFAIDRGNTVGATASNVQGFSNIGGAGTATGAGGGGGGGGFGGIGGLGGLGGLFGGAFNNLNQGGQGQQRQVRTRLRSAVPVAPLPPAQLEARLRSRVQNETVASRFNGTNISVDGRTATLSGEVSSAADSRMAALLMQLEPGVSRVDNQIHVNEASASDRFDGNAASPSLPSGWKPLPPPSAR